MNIDVPMGVQIVLSLVGATGLGGIAVRLWDRWLGHRATARKQTDEMAMHSNAAREARDRQLSEMRHAHAYDPTIYALDFVSRLPA